MAESDGRIGGLDNPTSAKTMSIVNDSDKRHQKQSKGNSNDGADEDSDNECWDEAKALLHTDEIDHKNICHNTRTLTEGIDSLDLSNRNQQTPTSSSTDTVDSPATARFKQPASNTSQQAPRSSFQSSTSHQPPETIASNSETTTTHTNTTTSSSFSFASGDELILHEAVFNNDTQKILTILNDAELVKRLELVNKRDKHGNTALHLACMMGRSARIISAFINNQHGFKWSVDAKNLNRWTPIHEACSYGDREVITLLTRQQLDDVDEALRNYNFKNILEKTKDYRMVLRWEFLSWLPFISRVLPSDVCVINKQGSYIRIDSKLLKYNSLFGQNNQIHMIYANGNWIWVHNNAKKYHLVEVPDHDIDKKVDISMATDIADMELKSSEMQLTRSTSGWIWKADRVDKVGKFHVALYDLDNVFLVTKKRREHLDEDDIKRNKNAYRNAINLIKFGTKKPNPQQDDATSAERPISDGYENGNNEEDNVDDSDDENESIVNRESLPPPQPAAVSWQQYLQAEPGNHPALGREQKCKIVKTAVKASVAMSEEFPLSKQELLDLLKIVPIKLFKKLEEFVELKLPNGFPVRFDIPIFPFLTARVTFEDFAYHEGPIDESLFRVPTEYKQA